MNPLSYVRATGWGKLVALKEHYEEALIQIAMPKRADGTYNLSREACEQIARGALRVCPQCGDPDCPGEANDDP